MTQRGKPQLRALKSVHEQEQETREHMIRRGGAERYRVKNLLLWEGA